MSEDKLCMKCFGCNRLEIAEFQGVYRCVNFISTEEE